MQEMKKRSGNSYKGHRSCLGCATYSLALTAMSLPLRDCVFTCIAGLAGDNPFELKACWSSLTINGVRNYYRIVDEFYLLSVAIYSDISFQKCEVQSQSIFYLQI